jgi:hypothetical protein
MSIRGLKLAQEIMAQPALRPFVLAERLPGPQVRTDRDYFDYASRTAKTDHHPAGTCRMGTDPAAVVDPELRFNGIAGLRVVDASIMPTVVSSNTNAPTIMIAEKAADMIKASHGMRWHDPPYRPDPVSRHVTEAADIAALFAELVAIAGKVPGILSPSIRGKAKAPRRSSAATCTASRWISPTGPRWPPIRTTPITAGLARRWWPRPRAGWTASSSSTCPWPGKPGGRDDPAAPVPRPARHPAAGTARGGRTTRPPPPGARHLPDPRAARRPAPPLRSPPMLILPTADFGLEPYRLTGTPLVPRAPKVPLSRTAFAAAHVVSDPLRERNPWDSRPAVDWEATLAFRQGLWDQGLGLAEAMDTAQRGMGVDWPTALELMQRTMTAARAHPLKPRVACGAGTDQRTAVELASLDAILAAYEEQFEALEAAGSQVILMATRALPALGARPADYHRIYRA